MKSAGYLSLSRSHCRSEIFCRQSQREGGFCFWCIIMNLGCRGIEYAMIIRFNLKVWYKSYIQSPSRLISIFKSFFQIKSIQKSPPSPPPNYFVQNNFFFFYILFFMFSLRQGFPTTTMGNAEGCTGSMFMLYSMLLSCICPFG